jgi:hypothetical protein
MVGTAGNSQTSTALINQRPTEAGARPVFKYLSVSVPSVLSVEFKKRVELMRVCFILKMRKLRMMMLRLRSA